jgi:hypothetical protein
MEHVLVPILSVIVMTVGFFALKKANAQARLRNKVLEITKSETAPCIVVPDDPTLAKQKFARAVGLIRTHQGWSIQPESAEATLRATMQWAGSVEGLDYYKQGGSRPDRTSTPVKVALALTASFSQVDSGCSINWIYSSETRDARTDDIMHSEAEIPEVCFSTSREILVAFGLLPQEN